MIQSTGGPPANQHSARRPSGRRIRSSDERRGIAARIQPAQDGCGDRRLGRNRGRGRAPAGRGRHGSRRPLRGQRDEGRGGRRVGHSSRRHGGGPAWRRRRADGDDRALRRRGRTFRRRRRGRQHRGDHAPGPARRDGAGSLRPDAPGQRPRDLRGLPARGPQAAPRRRADQLLHLGDPAPAARLRRLRGDQGRGRGHDPEPGTRTAWPGRHRQRGGPRADRDTAFRRGQERGADRPVAAAVPLERLGAPEDIAEAVAFLSGSAGRWINGQVLYSNGGIA